MIKIIKMDLTTAPPDSIILHGVNCQRAMGAGVAKSLYEKWSLVRSEYMKIPKSEMKLGMIQPVNINDDNRIVINCFTQEYYGRTSGKRYASPVAIRECLIKSLNYATDQGCHNIFMSPIGCSNAGLSFENDLVPILDLMDVLYPTLNITVCKL